jgi:hypothetical protein
MEKRGGHVSLCPPYVPVVQSAVIASEAKQSGAGKKSLDCFVAYAPRNDDVAAAYATALMTLPTLSMISPIWSSLMIKGGVSAKVSPAMRSIKSLLWKAASIA